MATNKFDKNMEKASAELGKVADGVKDTAEDLWNRWSKSALGERITMILWIIALIWALWELRWILWGVILLVLGVLLVSWFFDHAVEDLIAYCKKEYKSRNSSNTKTVKAKKSK